MLGLAALALALFYLVITFVPIRSAPVAAVRTAVILVAGALGIAHWHGGADSRWLVGGILAIAGGALGATSRLPRAARTGGIVLVVLGTALYAIATATTRHG